MSQHFDASYSQDNSSHLQEYTNGMSSIIIPKHDTHVLVAVNSSQASWTESQKRALENDVNDIVGPKPSQSHDTQQTQSASGNDGRSSIVRSSQQDGSGQLSDEDDDQTQHASSDDTQWISSSQNDGQQFDRDDDQLRNRRLLSDNVQRNGPRSSQPEAWIPLSQTIDPDVATLRVLAKIESYNRHERMKPSMDCEIILDPGVTLQPQQRLLLKVKFAWSSLEKNSNRKKSKATVTIKELFGRVVAEFSLEGHFSNQSFEAVLYDYTDGETKKRADKEEKKRRWLEYGQGRVRNHEDDYEEEDEDSLQRRFFITDNSNEEEKIYVFRSRRRDGMKDLPMKQFEMLETAHRAALEAQIRVASPRKPETVNIEQRVEGGGNPRVWGKLSLISGLGFGDEPDGKRGSVRLYSSGIGRIGDL
ncbi:hypothetical protein VKT23_008955 [Stygiomarasmius scandens]|uniref:Uncharacterized protein n=1 Tax=Marasmiellus scandens TaxID=2682957 RepID=A0ABR1JGN7_9AGAR